MKKSIFVTYVAGRQVGNVQVRAESRKESYFDLVGKASKWIEEEKGIKEFAITSVLKLD